jgi:hypothetical protein
MRANTGKSRDRAFSREGRAARGHASPSHSVVAYELRDVREPPFGAPVAVGWLAVEDAPELLFCLLVDPGTR